MEKMDANPLLLAQIAELNERVRLLEARQFANSAVVDTIVGVIREDDDTLPERFIEDLHESADQMQWLYENRQRLRQRPDWEWEALNAAASLLWRKFGRAFSDLQAQRDEDD